MITCTRCGATAEAAAEPSWSCELVDGEQRWLCAACTREHLRSIEAKLDDAWW